MIYAFVKRLGITDGYGEYDITLSRVTEEILAEMSLKHIYRRCRYGGFIYRVPERQVERYKGKEEELVSIIVRAYANEDPEEIVFIAEPQEAQVS